MFEFITPLGKIYLFQTHLPLEPLVTKVEFLWYSERKMWSILFIFILLLLLLYYFKLNLIFYNNF